MTHPYLGVVVGRLTPQISQALNTGTDRGVLVRDVATGDPAARAGLKPGDVVTGFAGQPVTTVEEFLGELRGVEPGQRIQLTLVRSGVEQTVEVTVGAAELSVEVYAPGRTGAQMRRAGDRGPSAPGAVRRSAARGPRLSPARPRRR